MRGLGQWVILIGLITSATGSLSTPAATQDPVRLVVGFGAGGAYDRVTRVVGNHLGKYLPGHPKVITQNMVGAGGLMSVNYVFSIAPKDGSVIGNFDGATFTNEIIDLKNASYRSLDFEWVGAISKVRVSCLVRKGALERPDDVMKPGGKQLLIGVQGVGSQTTTTPIFLRDALGANFKIVSGYPSLPQIYLAVQQGELDGACANWESLRVTVRDQLQSGVFKIFLQDGDTKAPDLPDAALITAYLDTPEKKALWAALTKSQQISRAFALPPAVPGDRVAVVRKAFADTMQDPDFIAEMNRVGETLAPSTASEVEVVVRQIISTPAELKGQLRKILTATQ